MPGKEATPDMRAGSDLPSASLAHELKTPVAASEAAIMNLRERLPELLQAVDLPGNSPEWTAVLSFAAHNMMDPAPGPLLGLEGQRKATALAVALRKAGAGERAESAADILVRFGWDTHLDEIGPALGAEWGEEALTLLDAAGRIRSSLWSLTNSLEKIEEITIRVGEGSGEVPTGVADLRECAEAAVEILQHATPPEVRVEIEDEGRPFAVADAVRVEQILTNLVGNALDAVVEKGGVISISCSAAGDGATVSVQDNGPGISEAVRERLFSPFATSKEEGKGTGLGLYISRRLAEEMGGSLDLRTSPGATSFELRLPAAAGHAEPGGDGA